MNIHQIVEIELKYGIKPTPEQLTAYKKQTNTELKLNEDGTVHYWSRPLSISLDKALQLKIPFEILKVLDYVGTESLVAQGIQQAAQTVGPVNERCQVIVGSSAYNVTEVKLLADQCTDSLQCELNDGWHILAVCVQPNQRRPDYVMGKS